MAHKQKLDQNYVKSNKAFLINFCQFFLGIIRIYGTGAFCYFHMTAGGTPFPNSPFFKKTQLLPHHWRAICIQSSLCLIHSQFNFAPQVMSLVTRSNSFAPSPFSVGLCVIYVYLDPTVRFWWGNIFSTDATWSLFWISAMHRFISGCLFRMFLCMLQKVI